MSRSTAQQLQVSIGGDQTVEISPAESHSTAQALTVELSVDQIVVQINPAQKLPTE